MRKASADLLASPLTGYHNTSSVEEMLEDLDWPTLQERQHTARLTMLDKISNNLVCAECADLTRQPDSVRRGHSMMYTMIQCLTCTDDRANTFPRTISTWNVLPHEVAQDPSLGTFISKVSSQQYILQYPILFLFARQTFMITETVSVLVCVFILANDSSETA